MYIYSFILFCSYAMSITWRKTSSSGAATFGSMIKLHGQNGDLQQVWPQPQTPFLAAI